MYVSVYNSYLSLSDLLHSIQWALVSSTSLEQIQMRSFLWLSPLYVSTTIFFIHASISGHLGCFLVLAIVNSAVMNNGIHVSFSILVSPGYMPRSGIAGSYTGFIPSLLRISTLSSIVAVSIYIPTNSARVFPFLHTFSSISCL